VSSLPDPLHTTLRDYCHVEWFELDELVEDVRSRRQKFDVDLLKAQFESLLSEDVVDQDLINRLTANEFESQAEVKSWLEAIYRRVWA